MGCSPTLSEVFNTRHLEVMAQRTGLIGKGFEDRKSQGELKQAIRKKAPVLIRLPEEEERPNKGHCADNGPVGLPGLPNRSCDFRFARHSPSCRHDLGSGCVRDFYCCNPPHLPYCRSCSLTGFHPKVSLVDWAGDGPTSLPARFLSFPVF